MIDSVEVMLSDSSNELEAWVNSIPHFRCERKMKGTKKEDLEK